MTTDAQTTSDLAHAGYNSPPAADATAVLGSHSGPGIPVQPPQGLDWRCLRPWLVAMDDDVWSRFKGSNPDRCAVTHETARKEPLDPVGRLNEGRIHALPRGRAAARCGS
jgi:hypothetical protein